MQERRIIDGITSSLAIMHRAYVLLIVLAAVFSMAWYKIVEGAENTSDAWDIQTIVSIWHEKMFGYLSLDIVCSEKRTVFRERSSRKTVSFEEQIMSKDISEYSFALNGCYFV